VAERVLSNIFKNVTRMKMNHTGYDFICGKGFKIDVKSSCGEEGWNFILKQNKIADYFLCLAFDNRESLNPQFLWLIPGPVVNYKTGLHIQRSQSAKWKEYELPIERVMECCSSLKEIDVDGMPEV
jgi:hypothetical protein